MGALNNSLKIANFHEFLFASQYLLEGLFHQLRGSRENAVGDSGVLQGEDHSRKPTHVFPAHSGQEDIVQSGRSQPGNGSEKQDIAMSGQKRCQGRKKNNGLVASQTVIIKYLTCVRA